ncbi:MAG: aconitate hydratase AcnA [Gammaproteobacteria bacterium]|nr:aconitate hydratase AcnA [Gammaproteobacteria bacterium]MYF02411.1 aconitate hydratase AcnA [Gammaproteobacteria bacterium]MYI77789.1 aconitate hydratase AcnA [Gammaproteobacteria bacterium]
MVYTVYRNSFNSQHTLRVKDEEYIYHDLNRASEHGAGEISRLPVSLRVLLENLLRHEDGTTVTAEDVQHLANWNRVHPKDRDIAYRPARVLMQDFTGVPAVADLAAMREAVERAGKDPQIINPLTPVDLVIDHSVMVDHFGSDDAFDANVALEISRNSERYRFLKWGQNAFSNFSVVPPGTGICHQVNLEYLARVVWTSETSNGTTTAYPDTLVGTDSHTTMINALGVLGWGVGGIEAEAAMLGQPISMLIPKVVGVHLTGALRDGVTATDLVLVIVERLRQHGVVGCFVEFYGAGLETLSLADRATIANMAPEYGATCGFFPIDSETLTYLRLSSRPERTVALVEAYAKQQGLWRDDDVPPHFSEVIELDIATIEPSVAGPKRPQDRVPLDRIRSAFELAASQYGVGEQDISQSTAITGEDYSISHGDVVIAAITSCTNTSNPAVMLAAGLIAEKALENGLSVKPWVKTSLAPGSKVVSEYLEHTNLQDALDQIGFNLVGYGCTTCIGNSGPLPKPISTAISRGNLVVAAVLSGNRNFEGRIHQEVKTNWLASPPLVVAFALAGTTKINFSTMPIAQDSNGDDVYLRDLWPTTEELQSQLQKVSAEMFARQYADVFTGPPEWRSMEAAQTASYDWADSTYVKQPPFFSSSQSSNYAVEFDNANILALLGDSLTTDHISPAGAIQAASPAGQYLQQHDVAVQDFNSYGSRRGNHEVMMRGTFANIRIRNEMVPGTEGGYTLHIPSAEQVSIYEASQRYAKTNTPLVVVAGKEYGTGSSRDWAAKGTKLIGIVAVIAESFERIHRSNLVGMGVLPLEFPTDVSRKTLNLTGREQLSLGFPDGTDTLKPKQNLCLTIKYADGSSQSIEVRARIDTPNEIEYFRAGGILQYVLENLLDDS